MYLPVGDYKMDSMKIIKIILKLSLYMKKEDWQGLLGMLGCMGATVVIILGGIVVCLILAIPISIILSIFQIEYDFETIFATMTTLVPVSLFLLHIYRAYKNGFYSKTN